MVGSRYVCATPRTRREHFLSLSGVKLASERWQCGRMNQRRRLIDTVGVLTIRSTVDGADPCPFTLTLPAYCSRS